MGLFSKKKQVSNIVFNQNGTVTRTGVTAKTGQYAVKSPVMKIGASIDRLTNAVIQSQSDSDWEKVASRINANIAENPDFYLTDGT